MQDLVNLVVNNGLGVVCVIYMIHFQNTTMKEMLGTLQVMNERLKDIENKIK